MVYYWIYQIMVYENLRSWGLNMETEHCSTAPRLLSSPDFFLRTKGSKGFKVKLLIYQRLTKYMKLNSGMYLDVHPTNRKVYNPYIYIIHIYILYYILYIYTHAILHIYISIYTMCIYIICNPYIPLSYIEVGIFPIKVGDFDPCISHLLSGSRTPR